MDRFTICGDSHGDRADAGAVAAFREFVKMWKPTIRVHLGDLIDARAFRKKATDEETRDGIGADFDAAMEFLRWYRPTHFLRGNHDERLWDCVKGDDKRLAGLVGTLTSEIEEHLSDTKCAMLPYDKRRGVLKLGHLKVIHGYSAGVTAARLTAQVYGSVVMGHIHTIDHYSIPGIERRIGRAIGCLCQLDQDYNRAQLQTLRQAHGWAYGILLPGGEYQLWQAEQVGGAWYFPTEVKRVEAKSN